jgi:membrane protein DedA with SNARE-associated domain
MLQSTVPFVPDWLDANALLQLSPVWMALLLGAFSLLFEDIALLIGVAILHHDMGLMWPVFLGLYVGIVGGDLMLYASGRWLNRFPAVARLSARPAVAARMGRIRAALFPMLVLSRAIPASRLPTFLAAGIARVSFAKFVLIIAVTVLVWTGAILFGGASLSIAFSQTFGFSLLWLFIPAAVFLLVPVFSK